MKEILNLCLVLGAICIISAVALAQVYSMTKEPIATAAEAEAKDAAKLVLEPILAGGATIEKKENIGGKKAVYVAMSDGQPKGFAYLISSKKGYAGEIQSMIGLDIAGNLIGYKAVIHGETPGLGSNIATNVKWIHQIVFKGQQPRNLENTDWRVKKDGGEIDALSGATISPRAVVGSIKEGLEWFRDNRAALTGEPAASAAAALAVPPAEPTPDAKLEEGGVADPKLPAAVPLPKITKTPPPIAGKDLTE
ncbi:MAG: RnfABCDGE type electron transport complex subunit G [Myxococcales bacterium]|nr:RnfABCDGE type electron transport complex subunit G [Myxococcales bacterium]